MKPRNDHFLLGAIVIFSAFLTPLQSNAKLVFENTHIRSIVNPSENIANFVFKFTNSGPSSVSITKVDKSCGCLSARFNKDTYGATESGYLSIALTTTGLEGSISKQVSVYTDDNPNKSQDLVVTAEVPKYFEITPRALYWQQNGDRHERIVKIMKLSSKPLKIVSAISSSETFRVNIDTVSENGTILIRVSPQTVEHVSKATLEVNILIETDILIKKTVYLRTIPDHNGAANGNKALR